MMLPNRCTCNVSKQFYLYLRSIIKVFRSKRRTFLIGCVDLPKMKWTKMERQMTQNGPKWKLNSIIEDFS